MMRDSLSFEARRRKSAEIWENFLSLEEIALAETILLYAAHLSEVETLGLIEQLLARGKRVGLPVVVANSFVLVLRETASTTNLEKGTFGIMVPPSTSPEIPYSEIEVVALPGVAFDRDCWRVGYGGGFYDRLLASSSAGTVGLAFECQLMPSIPTQCHDEQLDAVVTESNVFRRPAS